MAIDRNDPEVLALIEEITSPLTKKRDELLAELRSAKAKAKGADIDPEDYARLQGEVESLTDRLTSTEKKLKGDSEKLTKQLAEKDGALSAYLVDAGIAEALAKGGVAPQFVKPLQAMFKASAALKSEGGQYTAAIGEKPLGDAIGEYLGSDEGKHFVAASMSSGGGASGGGAGGGAKKFADMSSEERTALYRKDPRAYESAKAAG